MGSNNSNHSKEAIKISTVSIIVDIVLTILKITAGILGQSVALVSDAIHSFSDVITTILVIIGVKISEKAPDKEHPYGHEKLECLISIALALSLFSVGIGIGISGISSIHNKLFTIPKSYTLLIALISIVSKETMFWLTIKVAKRVQSPSLKADAWHHRSDALSSIGSFIGILLTTFGFYYGDAIASVVICIFIIRVALDILFDAINSIIDHSCDSDTENNILNIIKKTNGVQRIDDMKTRRFGSKVYVDVEIAVDGDMKLTDAHNIAENVHHRVESHIQNCKHCMVHINPIN